MDQNFCPNYKGCQIIVNDLFVTDQNKKQYYLQTYCEAGNDSWKACMRFKTKLALNFCPEYILPDSNFTIDEILDKFEELSNT
jgi:hypothetical protein